MTDAAGAVSDRSGGLDRSERTVFAGLMMGLLALGPRILAAYLSGSITLLTDLLRSGTETLSHLSSWIVLRKIRRGRDAVFEFGLGKLESVASFLIIQAMLLSAAIMAWASIQRLLNPRPLDRLGFGIVVVLALSVSNFFLWRRSERLAISSDSPLMSSHARLVRNKFLANCCVLVSLTIGTFGRGIPELVYVDPLTSLLLCGFIAGSACRLLAGSLADLLDRTLDESRQLVIVRLLGDFFNEYVQLHGVRSRRSGRHVFIEIFLEFDGRRTVAEVGQTITAMAESLAAKLPGSQVTIVPCTKPPRSLER